MSFCIIFFLTRVTNGFIKQNKVISDPPFCPVRQPFVPTAQIDLLPSSPVLWSVDSNIQCNFFVVLSSQMAARQFCVDQAGLLRVRYNAGLSHWQIFGTQVAFLPQAET